jgi:hypothetical protein
VEGRVDQGPRATTAVAPTAYFPRERLIMRVTVSATQLPKNVVYTLTYERD